MVEVVLDQRELVVPLKLASLEDVLDDVSLMVGKMPSSVLAG